MYIHSNTCNSCGRTNSTGSTSCNSYRCNLYSWYWNDHGDITRAGSRYQL